MVCKPLLDLRCLLWRTCNNVSKLFLSSLLGLFYPFRTNAFAAAEQVKEYGALNRIANFFPETCFRPSPAPPQSSFFGPWLSDTKKTSQWNVCRGYFFSRFEGWLVFCDHSTRAAVALQYGVSLELESVPWKYQDEPLRRSASCRQRVLNYSVLASVVVNESFDLVVILHRFEFPLRNDFGAILRLNHVAVLH